MQIEEQLNQLEDKVTVLVNAVQQLHHRQGAIDLLTSEQMVILHLAVQEKLKKMDLMHWPLKYQTIAKWKLRTLEMMTMTLLSS
jgi:CO dehydrogenase nickel-insertion accessory protein CooC1